MQSGTILHLALLKKLSSRSPQTKYSQRFAKFRIKQSLTTKNYHSAELFQKYPPSEERKLDVSTTKTKVRPLKMPRKKTVACVQGYLKEQDLNVCGWSIENQQDFDFYLKSDVKNKDSKNVPKTKTHYPFQPKFTFCQGQLQHSWRKKQKKREDPSHVNRIEMKTVCLNPSFTESDPSEKENRVKDGIQSPFPFFRNRLSRRQTKESHKNKKPLIELAITHFKEGF